MITTIILDNCKEKLLNEKASTMNRLTSLYEEFSLQEKTGDEGDLSNHNIVENQFLTTSRRLRKHLLEVETALMRIHSGLFGICEETQEEIEVARLKAIPWTRLSIEGAEIRDSLSKRFA